MSTFNTTRNRLTVLAALLATFAASAQAAEAASPVVDTQARVSAVLAGTRAELNFREVIAADAASHATDVQQATQRILLGTNGSNGNQSTHTSTQPSVGSNGHSGDDAQKLAQAVVLGRSAS
jgi:hypothetical protein